jgi:hypothetical protein
LTALTGRPNGRPLGKMTNLGCQGHTCETCHRRVTPTDEAAEKRREISGHRAAPIECCQFCGKWPLDIALCERGYMQVAREMSRAQEGERESA